MFKFIIYKIGQFIVKRLPIKASYRFAIFFSDCHYFFSFRDRKAVKNNLRIIRPDESEENISKLTREVFRNFGKYLVEFFRMADELDQDFIKENIKIHGVEYINQALEDGKGVVILTGHIGNWELGSVVLSLLGYSSVVIALPHKERPVNELFNRQRESKGVTVIPIQQAIRRCMEALKNNQLVGIVADRAFTTHGEILDFLGRKTLIPKGPALFSIKSGAAIVPCFLTRNDDDTFSLNILAPIYPSNIPHFDNEREMLRYYIQHYTSVLEKQIRKYPTQWLMFRRFWITS